MSNRDRTYYSECIPELDVPFVFHVTDFEDEDSVTIPHDVPNYVLWYNTIDGGFPVVTYGRDARWVHSRDEDWGRTTDEGVPPTPMFYNVLKHYVEVEEPVPSVHWDVLPLYERSCIASVTNTIRNEGYSSEIEHLIAYAVDVGHELGTVKTSRSEET